MKPFLIAITAYSMLLGCRQESAKQDVSKADTFIRLCLEYADSVYVTGKDSVLCGLYEIDQDPWLNVPYITTLLPTDSLSYYPTSIRVARNLIFIEMEYGLTQFVFRGRAYNAITKHPVFIFGSMNGCEIYFSHPGSPVHCNVADEIADGILYKIRWIWRKYSDNNNQWPADYHSELPELDSLYLKNHGKEYKLCSSLKFSNYSCDEYIDLLNAELRTQP